MSAARKPIMTVSLFAVGLLTLACALAPGWGVLLGLRALTGIALAGVPAVAMAYLAEEVHPRDLGVAMGLYIAGNAYGGMAGRVVIGVLIDVTHSWRLSVAVMGGFGLVAAALFAGLLPPSRRFEPAQGLSIAHLGGAFGRHLRDPVLVMLFGLGFVLMGGFVTTYNYLSYRLLAPPFDLSQAWAGSIFLVYSLGGPFSAWLGRQSGRYGLGRTMIAAIALEFSGLLLTAVPNLPVAILAIAVFTCGFFGAHAIASGWVSRRAGQRPRRGGLALPLRLLPRLQPVRLDRRHLLVAGGLAGHHGPRRRADPRRAGARARARAAGAPAELARRHGVAQREPDGGEQREQDRGIGGDRARRQRAAVGERGAGRPAPVGALAGERRLGEVAVGGEPARRALADDVGGQLRIVGRAALARLERVEPVELVLLVDRIGDEPGDVAVVRDEAAEDAVALRALAVRALAFGPPGSRPPRAARACRRAAAAAARPVVSRVSRRPSSSPSLNGIRSNHPMGRLEGGSRRATGSTTRQQR